MADQQELANNLNNTAKAIDNVAASSGKAVPKIQALLRAVEQANTALSQLSIMKTGLLTGTPVDLPPNLQKLTPARAIGRITAKETTLRGRLNKAEVALAGYYSSMEAAIVQDGLTVAQEVGGSVAEQVMRNSGIAARKAIQRARVGNVAAGESPRVRRTRLEDAAKVVARTVGLTTIPTTFVTPLTTKSPAELAQEVERATQVRDAVNTEAVATAKAAAAERTRLRRQAKIDKDVAELAAKEATTGEVLRPNQAPLAVRQENAIRRQEYLEAQRADKVRVAGAKPFSVVVDEPSRKLPSLQQILEAETKTPKPRPSILETGEKLVAQQLEDAIKANPPTRVLKATKDAAAKVNKATASVVDESSIAAANARASIIEAELKKVPPAGIGGGGRRRGGAGAGGVSPQIPSMDLQQLFAKTGFKGNMAEATKYVEKLKMSMSDIKSATTDAVTGVTQFGFENKKAAGSLGEITGASTSATVAMDRYGQVTNRTTSRGRAFSDVLQRNIVSSLQWAISIGLVYGIINKLSTAMTSLIDVNEAMSNIAFSTGESTDAVVRFFDASAEAARATGTDVMKVLNIYDDAIRATSSFAAKPERFAVTDALVRQALTFSRLSGVAPEESMDLIISSIRQLAETSSGTADSSEVMFNAFQQGDKILDAMVYLARSANIQLSDLAETFSVTGAAAQEAGVDMITLGAMATVLSEATSKSASEVGNTLRRLIGQTESETGMKALEKYAISVRKVDGTMKDWDDTMAEIARKVAAGVISRDALREIAYAIGGGPRGSADFIILINQQAQVIAKAEAARTKSSGAAATAMAIKERTLTSELANLNTAFIKLTQTLGESGLIGGLSNVLDMMTKVLDMTTGLTEALGNASVRLIALGGAGAVLAKYSPQLNTFFQTAYASYRGPAYAQQTGPNAYNQQFFTRPSATPSIPSPSIGQRLGSNVGGLGLAGAYAAIAVDKEAPFAQNAVKVGGIVGGAVVGTIVANSPLIGAAIGDILSSIIITGMDESALLAKPIAEKTVEELVASSKLLEEKLKPKTLMEDILSVGAVPMMGPTYTKLLAETEEALKNKGLTTTGEVLPPPPLVPTEEDIKTVRYQKKFDTFTEEINKKRQDALASFAKKDITSAQFKDILANMEDFGNRGGIIFEEISDITGDSEAAMRKFMDVMISASPTAIEELVRVVLEVNKLEAAITELPVATGELASIQSEELKRLITLRNTARESLKGYWEIVKETTAEPLQFKGFTDLSDLTEPEFQKLKIQALELQDTYAAVFGYSTKEMASMMEDWVRINKEGAFSIEKGWSESFLALAKKQEEARKGPFNLQRLRDVEPEDFSTLERMVRKWEAILSTIPGYTENNPQEPQNLVIGEEGVVRRIVSSQDALTYALEELNETTKKQLEGMWNIPEGATVMVPLQSLYYKPKNAPTGPEPIPGSVVPGPIPWGTTEVPGAIPGTGAATTGLDTVGLAAIDAATALDILTTGYLRIGGGEYPRAPITTPLPSIPPEVLARFEELKKPFSILPGIMEEFDKLKEPPVVSPGTTTTTTTTRNAGDVIQLWLEGLLGISRSAITPSPTVEPPGTPGYTLPSPITPPWDIHEIPPHPSMPNPTTLPTMEVAPLATAGESLSLTAKVMDASFSGPFTTGLTSFASSVSTFDSVTSIFRSASADMGAAADVLKNAQFTVNTAINMDGKLIASHVAKYLSGNFGAAAAASTGGGAGGDIG